MRFGLEGPPAVEISSLLDAELVNAGISSRTTEAGTSFLTGIAGKATADRERFSGDCR